MGALRWDDLCIFPSLLALGAEAVVDVIAIAPLLSQDMWSLRDHDLGSFFFWKTVLLMSLYFLQATSSVPRSSSSSCASLQPRRRPTGARSWA